jgi:hypothetical protein
MNNRIFKACQPLIEQLEARTLLAFAGQVVAYLPDYESGVNNQIDYSALTHLNYFSIVPNADGTMPSTTVDGHPFSELDSVVTLAHAKGVAVSITIDPASPFLGIAGDATKTSNFITGILSFCNTHRLDGVDMDFEPGSLTSAQKNTYGSFLATVHAQTSAHGLSLTAAVQASQQIIPLAYSSALDWYYLMDYDLAFNDSAPLADSETYLSNWVNYGIPKSKLLMGVPFYGRAGTSWSDSTTLSYSAIVSGAGFPGPGANSATVGGKTYGYNGITLMQTKAQYVLQNGFAGMMIWELGQDHFTNNAYDSTSLLPAIKTAMTVANPSWISASTPAASYAINGNQLTVLHGTVTMTADASTSVAQLNATVAVGGRLVTATTQHLATVALNGSFDIGSNPVFTTDSTSTLLTSIQSGMLFTSTTGLAVGYLDAGGGTFEVRGVLAGDANLDGAVNVADLADLAGNFGKTSGQTWIGGDFDYNGNVNVADLADLAANFGQTLSAGSATAAAVPSSSSSAVSTIRETTTVSNVSDQAWRVAPAEDLFNDTIVLGDYSKRVWNRLGSVTR